jgi:hypothetical protein
MKFRPNPATFVTAGPGADNAPEPPMLHAPHDVINAWVEARDAARARTPLTARPWSAGVPLSALCADAAERREIDELLGALIAQMIREIDSDL